MDFKPYVPTYTFHVNLDERGMFYADVRNQNGRTLFEIKIDESLPDDEQSNPIEDGWMKHGRDLDGLRAYLIHLGVVTEKAVLVWAA
jgi:hypothetical protein